MVEVEPDDVAHFVDKQRVVRQLEVFDAVRLQRIRACRQLPQGSRNGY